MYTSFLHHHVNVHLSELVAYNQQPSKQIYRFHLPSNKKYDIFHIMDILEQYEKQYSSTPQEQHGEYANIRENAKITKWLINHSSGYITSKKQANYVIIGFAIFIVLASLFLTLNRNKFSLTHDEAKLFIGKTASEKLLVPQERDRSLFHK